MGDEDIAEALNDLNEALEDGKDRGLTKQDALDEVRRVYS